MKALKKLVIEVQNGHSDAYNAIIRRFQDMAVGYTFSCACMCGQVEIAESLMESGIPPRVRVPAFSLSRLRERDVEHSETG